MRKIVSWEGEVKTPNILIDKGALEFPDEPVVVTWNYDHDNINAILGKASEFKREEDGSITAEISLRDPEQHQFLADDDNISFAVWATHVREDGEKTSALRHVHYGKIRSVAALLKDGGYPGW